MEVIGDKVVVTVLLDRRSERGKVSCVAKHVVLNGLEDLLQGGVQLEVTIEVTVTEIFNIFSKISKEEDVLVTNLSGYFDLLNFI